MRPTKTILFAIMVLAVVACHSERNDVGSSNSEGPSKVELRNVDGKYRLYVNGQKFYVKGAGCNYGPCYKVAEHGGNSIRTWSVGNEEKTAMEILNEAWEHGLMVMMGIYVANERHGFDYDDQQAVGQQLERIRKEVLDIKDHPALLGYGIGNELNLSYSNMKVWDAVNDIARMIKEVDGNHVTTTMLAGIGKKEVEYIQNNCPDIDFLSIQLYGSIIYLEERLKNANYNGPYLITEWGATGHWEVPSTEWGAPIEQTSTEKAEAIKERYQKAILADEANCMGSYVFLWGQKQERTPTWYGLFTEYGEQTEAINMMEYLWTNKKPDNPGPRILDIQILGEGDRYDNVYLEKDQLYTTILSIEHPNITNLAVRAEIIPEPTELGKGGDYEPRPDSIDGLILSTGIPEITFKAPKKSGAYRIFVYVVDQHHQAATANIPFYVRH
jgi:hypothetical protein